LPYFSGLVVSRKSLVIFGLLYPHSRARGLLIHYWKESGGRRINAATDPLNNSIDFFHDLPAKAHRESACEWGIVWNMTWYLVMFSFLWWDESRWIYAILRLLISTRAAVKFFAAVIPSRIHSLQSPSEFGFHQASQSSSERLNTFTFEEPPCHTPQFPNHICETAELAYFSPWGSKMSEIVGSFISR
jgi:hypothetical protein